MRAPALRLALLLTVAVPLRQSAGQQQPTSIPIDLAIALLDHGESASGNRSPVIVVSRAPAGIPTSLTSVEGAAVIGGVEYPQSSVLVLGFTRPPNQVLVALDKQLTTRGWRPPPAPPQPEQSGFVNSAYASFGYDGGMGTTYCGDSGVVTVSYAPAPGGGTYLKLQHSRDIERGMCNPNRQRFYSFSQKVLKLPPLYSPPLMTQRGGGGGGGGDNIEYSAYLYGPLDAAELVAHYAKQLENAGWKMGSIVTTGSSAVASSEAKDQDGQQWTGLFIATRYNPTQVTVSVRMGRASSIR